MSNREGHLSDRFRIEPRYTSSTKPPGPPIEGWQRIGWFREARDYLIEAKLGPGGKNSKLRARAFRRDDL
jgi:hypothetical protein